MKSKWILGLSVAVIDGIAWVIAPSIQNRDVTAYSMLLAMLNASLPTLAVVLRFFESKANYGYSIRPAIFIASQFVLLSIGHTMFSMANVRFMGFLLDGDVLRTTLLKISVLTETIGRPMVSVLMVCLAMRMSRRPGDSSRMTDTGKGGY